MEICHSVILTLLMLDASIGGKMSFSYFDFTNVGCK